MFNPILMLTSTNYKACFSFPLLGASTFNPIPKLQAVEIAASSSLNHQRCSESDQLTAVENVLTEPCACGEGQGSCVLIVGKAV